jgi:hypothetical protein
MVAEATVDQQVDLAFGELVQAGGLQHAQADARGGQAALLRGAKCRSRLTIPPPCMAGSSCGSS